MNFKLHLKNSDGLIKVANFNPYLSNLKWLDDNQDVISDLEKKEIFFPLIHKTSPTSPAKKIKELKTIKIQMGFACNYTCNYCSQNNQRPNASENIQQSILKAENFISKISNWFSLEQNKDASDVFIEFWGGETLLYWPAVLKLAKHFRTIYPKINLGLFTNGSLITKEMADTALDLKIHFIISHDGPTFNLDRSKDPLEIPEQKENILYLFSKLQPLGLISFNATLSIRNYSLIDIRNYISSKLGVDNKLIVLSSELATPYDDAGMNYVVKESDREKLINAIYTEYLKQYPFELALGSLDRHLLDFFDSIGNKRLADTVGQKCTMDLPTSIAIDLDGNVLTCQNVTAKAGHKIGHIDHFDKIELNTSYHWSQRKECNNCPVVQICKGSCMFLTNKLWLSACDQHFVWGLAFLAFALKVATGYELSKIESDSIRNFPESEIYIINPK